MCTAITYRTNDHYFGRNLDLECSYSESVTITPRGFPLHFRMVSDLPSHFAMIGTAYITDDYPLYYDATNEVGLSMAALNFPGNALYGAPDHQKENLSPFELIPWLLGQCKSAIEARALLNQIQIIDLPFSDSLPNTPLHWILADATEAITVEATASGLVIHENPIGVLTNNPPFAYHLTNLSNYMQLSRMPPENRLLPELDLTPYSRGMGALGLPGDLSSASRFIRAAFIKANAVSDGSEADSVNQFFHILHAVEQQRGCVQLPDGSYEITVYSSCCNTSKGIYYYTTYTNQQISAVHLHHENLDGTALISYALRTQQAFFDQN